MVIYLVVGSWPPRIQVIYSVVYLQVQGTMRIHHSISSFFIRFWRFIQNGDIREQEPSGERRTPVGPGTSVSGGVGTRECVLKLSWPSTAEYRMMRYKVNKPSWSNTR